LLTGLVVDVVEWRESVLYKKENEIGVTSEAAIVRVS
jgi:hypothetical protein